MLRLTETRVDEDDEADDVKQKEKDSEDDQNDLERRQIDLICSVQQTTHFVTAFDCICHIQGRCRPPRTHPTPD